MTQPTPPPDSDPALDDQGLPDHATDPAAEWVRDHEPPTSEAERQVQQTVRSVSRLEESN